MELLLLSNSRTVSGFLVDYLEEIRAFAGTARKAAFIPFASVQRPWPEFTRMVGDALQHFELRMVEGPDDLRDAEMVVVSGGNTFQLLKECRNRELLAPLKKKILSGTRYLGWSAGSNLACPTIKTTNDMPIVDPGSLEALGLLPFQLNPHYTSKSIPGHQGETRDQRLAEFAAVNPDVPVLGLPEGDWLRVSGARLELKGPHEAVWFHAGRRIPVPPGMLSPAGPQGT
ncbi:MAG TPA: dipeptidase PepE [Caulobacteraceae bacterium]|nr:dipeptidase PepE [Caulobacteraceae bacterium]